MTTARPTRVVNAVQIRIEPIESQPGPSSKYSVTVRAKRLSGPGRLQVPSNLAGGLDAGLCDGFRQTYNVISKTTGNIGAADQHALASVNSALRQHAAELAQVLWGRAVWGEYANQWRTWWDKLNGADCFTIVELVLDSRLQGFLWESLLCSTLLASQFAIVRFVAEAFRDDRKDFARPDNPRWGMLVVEEKRDAADIELHDSFFARTRAAPGAKHHMMPIRGGGKPAETDLQAITRAIADFSPLALLIIVCHGEDRALVLRDAQRHPDRVDVDRLCGALSLDPPQIVFLIACELGSGQFLDWANNLLRLCKAVVAMQLDISNEAALGFFNALFPAESEPSQYLSIESLCEFVTKARVQVFSGPLQYVEMATPVIYARVSLFDLVFPSQRTVSAPPEQREDAHVEALRTDADSQTRSVRGCAQGFASRSKAHENRSGLLEAIRTKVNGAPACAVRIGVVVALIVIIAFLIVTLHELFTSQHAPPSENTCAIPVELLFNVTGASTVGTQGSVTIIAQQGAAPQLTIGLILPPSCQGLVGIVWTQNLTTEDHRIESKNLDKFNDSYGISQQAPGIGTVLELCAAVHSKKGSYSARNCLRFETKLW